MLEVEEVEVMRSTVMAHWGVVGCGELWCILAAVEMFWIARNFVLFWNSSFNVMRFVVFG